MTENLHAHAHAAPTAAVNFENPSIDQRFLHRIEMKMTADAVHALIQHTENAVR